jgi:uncharacterized protein (TIGR02147 family)
LEISRTQYSVTDAPDIFAYLDHRAFLSDWFDARKAANPRFSHRLFARLAQQKSPSLMLAVVRGKRNLTDTTTRAFAKAMKLDSEESSFFADLVRFDQATDSDERNRVWRRISASRRFRQARALDGEAFDYISHWYIVAARELAARGDFRDDPVWLSRQLRPTITLSEAKRALSTLKALGMLQDGKDGLQPADSTVVTPHEVAGLAARNYHRGMLDLARESIERFPPEQRHLGALTVCVPDALLPRLKEELAAFQERMLDLCDSADDAPDRVYQVQLAIFPLTAAHTEDDA